LQSISDHNQGHGGRQQFKGAPVVSKKTADLYHILTPGSIVLESQYTSDVYSY
jgi:hypothetical protein